MKIKFLQSLFLAALLFMSAISVSYAQFGSNVCMGAQTIKLNLNSTNSALLSGTPGVVGVKYKYTNANVGGTTSIDVIAELTAIQFGTVYNSTRFSLTPDQVGNPPSGAGFGVDGNFQPAFIGSTTSISNPNGTNENLFSTWKFTLVLNSNNAINVFAPVVAQIIDNDGGAGTTSAPTIRESVTSLTIPTAQTLSSTTNQTTTGSMVTGPTVNQGGIGTSPDYTAYFFYNNVNNFTLRFNHNINVANGTFNGPPSNFSRYSSMHVGCDYAGDVNFTLVSVRGNVFNDVNGLNGTPLNTVDGAGTNVGGLLFATLYDVTNSAAFITVPVNADGTYVFDGINVGTNYSVYIGNVNTPLGQTAFPTRTLPAGWVNTGENVGTSAGNDGTVNGIIALGVVNANVTNANFGIERLPTSTSQSFSIPTPVGGSTRTLNGTGTSTNPGPLRGSDSEDQPTVGSLSGKSVVINSLPNNGNQLFYNGVQITTIHFSIANYNPSLLAIKFTGTGSTSTTFTYSYVDAAGKSSASPATYMIDWATALPVKLISFSALPNGNTVKLVWEVADELNVEKYEVLHSVNGVSFISIGATPATGSKLYAYTDQLPSTGVSYYRLRTVDNDGKISLSDIRRISFGANSTLSVYPNPASRIINLNLTGDILNKTVKIKLVATDGKIVLQSNIARTSAIETLNISKLAVGSYILIITTADGQVVTSKIQVVR